MKYREKQLLELLEQHPSGCKLSIKEIAEILGVSKETVMINLRKLDNAGMITRSNYFVNKKRVYIIEVIKKGE
jgi:DeoR/GlpR family transcriptional regulator of sugar metabolism